MRSNSNARNAIHSQSLSFNNTYLITNACGSYAFRNDTDTGHVYVNHTVNTIPYEATIVRVQHTPTQ